MTLLTYQVFKTVTEQGSFRKAADLLGLTPSAVSHAVSSLEAELGFCVLNRAKSGVTLTNYGERLLPYVNAVLNSGGCRLFVGIQCRGYSNRAAVQRPSVMCRAKGAENIERTDEH